MKIVDCMKRDVVSITASASIDQAAALRRTANRSINRPTVCRLPRTTWLCTRSVNASRSSSTIRRW